MIPTGVSSGYMRLGGNVKNKHIGTTDLLASMIGPADAAIARAPVIPHIETELNPPDGPKLTAAQARQSGYTGDECSHCSSVRMKNNGHCLVCEDCGTSTGCS